MRLLSKIFQPILTVPKNAKIKSTEISCKSQKLLIECGLIRPTSSGLFALMPLARRSLNKLENIIKCELEAVGANQILIPSMVPASLWKTSGRLQEATELLTLTDRHDKKYILAPTHEESIADILSDIGTLSYKQLPLILYQISPKYRDEFRPKHGLLRSREFVMMDAYGIHTDVQSATDVYNNMTDVFQNIFHRLGLDVSRVLAPAGDMGGSISHEYHLTSALGEDVTSVCSNGHLHKGDMSDCHICHNSLTAHNTIEVGHTFILGTKYSQPLNATVSLATGENTPCYMSCYGIGITRLWSAATQHLCESIPEDKLRHAEGTAPYDLIIIPPKENSKEWQVHGLNETYGIYRMLDNIPGIQGDVLLDDRHHLTIGKRLMQAERMGYPHIVVCGKSILQDPPRYELHTSGLQPVFATREELLDIISKRDRREKISRTV